MLTVFDGNTIKIDLDNRLTIDFDLDLVQKRIVSEILTPQIVLKSYIVFL